MSAATAPGPAYDIIERLGGTREVARQLNLSKSSVQQWKESGWIPSYWLREVYRLAQRTGVELTAEELIGLPARVTRRAA